MEALALLPIRRTKLVGQACTDSTVIHRRRLDVSRIISLPIFYNLVVPVFLSRLIILVEDSFKVYASIVGEGVAPLWPCGDMQGFKQRVACPDINAFLKVHLILSRYKGTAAPIDWTPASSITCDWIFFHVNIQGASVASSRYLRVFEPLAPASLQS